MTDTMTVGSLNRFDKTYSRRSMFLRRFGAHKLAMTGGIVLAVVVAIALLGPLFAGDPLALNPSQRLAPPSLDHPFGTDNYGRHPHEPSPVPESLCSSERSQPSSLRCWGPSLRLFAAYNRIADACSTHAHLRRSDGVSRHPAGNRHHGSHGPADIERHHRTEHRLHPVRRSNRSAQALVAKEQTYVEALRSQGASLFRILWINIFPNVLSPLIVQATFVFADSIITEAA